MVAKRDSKLDFLTGDRQNIGTASGVSWRTFFSFGPRKSSRATELRMPKKLDTKMGMKAEVARRPCNCIN